MTRMENMLKEAMDTNDTDRLRLYYNRGVPDDIRESLRKEFWDFARKEDAAGRSLEVSTPSPKGVQSGFDFGETPSEDIKRSIESGPAREFALTSEAGALPTGAVEAIEEVKAPRKATLGLAEDPGRPLEDVTSFLNEIGRAHV